MNYDIRISEYGTKRYYVNNVLHREDGAAVEYEDGTNKWYKNGKRHRKNGPAIEWSNGSKEWYKMENVIEKMVQLLNTLVVIKSGG